MIFMCKEQICAILLAAGSGSRLSSAIGGKRKQFMQMQDSPLYWHSAKTLCAGGVESLVIVVPPDMLEEISKEISRLVFRDQPGIPVKIAAGGIERRDSVYNGLQLLPKGCKKVLVHDAARPFISPYLVRRVIAEITPQSPAVVPGISVPDTIKLVAEDNGEFVAASLPRERLRAIQTPQGFMAEVLLKAHMETQGRTCTDDAMLWESLGGKVKIVPGEEGNVKITTPGDLKHIVSDSQLPCTGFGYDVHRFGGDRPLRLGGVLIPGDYTVAAHSDGDVLMHSLIDALLGMASLGDIGRWFPDDDPKYDGIASSILLDNVLRKLQEMNIHITHIDMTVVAQRPKLVGHADQIVKNVASLLGLPGDYINFKATTEEKLGFTGSGEGIKAYCIATGIKKQSQTWHSL